jgi:hypothetical protein
MLRPRAEAAFLCGQARRRGHVVYLARNGCLQKCLLRLRSHGVFGCSPPFDGNAPGRKGMGDCRQDGTSGAHAYGLLCACTVPSSDPLNRVRCVISGLAISLDIHCCWSTMMPVGPRNVCLRMLLLYIIRLWGWQVNFLPSPSFVSVFAGSVFNSDGHVRVLRGGCRGASPRFL